MLTFPGIAALFTSPTKLGRSIRQPGLYQESVSGKVVANPFYTYPRRQFTLSYEVLTEDFSNLDWRTLESFYNLMNGRGTVFQFDDLYDDMVVNEPLGTGDGTTTAFQLRRRFGTYAFIEPVTVVNGAPLIYINGVLTGAFTLGSTGLVTFNSPPSNGAVLTWTGMFYWPCRFDMDKLDMSNDVRNYFSISGISFTTEKLL